MDFIIPLCRSNIGEITRFLTIDRKVKKCYDYVEKNLGAMIMHVPKVIDFFSGVGGLSLGAARAGFDVALAVENDKYALGTHTQNFPLVKHLNADISLLSGCKLLSETGLDFEEIDGVIGGPPCQGFSFIGRRDPGDKRNDLFLKMFELIAEIKPRFFLVENVLGILSEEHEPIRKKAMSMLPPSYIALSPIIVRASDFGAPTTRTRVFFIGYDPNRMKTSISEKAFGVAAFKSIEKVVVKRALFGLPESIGNDCKVNQGFIQVKKDNLNGYFEDRVFSHVPKGMGDPAFLTRFFESDEVSGNLGTRHLPAIVERFEKLKYGEQDKISKAVRLNPEGYCPTLRAGTASDRGSYQAVRPIHFAQPRVITPREAARLQGFPDWFVFHPTKWHSFRQIGNSVSPIVSERLLFKLFEAVG